MNPDVCAEMDDRAEGSEFCARLVMAVCFVWGLDVDLDAVYPPYIAALATAGTCQEVPNDR